jgi:hypothetical protein
VTHATRAGATAGIEVHAIGIGAEEQTILRNTKADAEGRFRFEDLPAPAAYLIRARFEGFVYPGGTAIFRPDEETSAPDVNFQVYDRTTDASGLSLAVVQWVIERDAGTYRVRQSATVKNSGQKVVAVEEDAPALLRVALAPGHGELQTVFGRLPAGTRMQDGLLELRGPIFPGDQGYRLEVAYDVESAPDGGMQTSLIAPDSIVELQVYIKDFGVEIDPGALHPARVARENDVFYQSFVGFDVPAGTRYALRVTPLPGDTTAPVWSVTLAAALLAGGLVFFVGRPVTRAAVESGRTVSEPDSVQERLRAALADLDHDFETGKLSDEDRDRLRDELRRDAARSLARERRLEPDPGTPAGTSCCGRAYAADDRFCSTCGKPL